VLRGVSCVLSVDSVECPVLAYVVCDARVHGSLWMVILIVSHLVMSMFCYCSVCGMHEHFSQSEIKCSCTPHTLQLYIVV
jgi:hypothetical protein